MMRVEIRLYNGTKYSDPAPAYRVWYDIESYMLVTGADAKRLIADTDGSCIDEHNEYLVLKTADGGTATFRNSHVDMFPAK